MSTITKTVDTPKMAVFTTAEALTVLWNRAKLQPHELEWFASGAGQEVSTETIAISEIMTNIGCLVLADQGSTGSFTDPEGVSTLMFNFASQLSTLNGLADIAVDANYRLRLALGGTP